MKKLLKWFGVLLLLLIACFGFYFYKLNALALEGNKLYEYRCTNVNPHLIAYKNSFLKFADYLQNPDNYEEGEVKGFYGGYIDGMKAYVPEEEKWLTMQYEFTNRWDFKLFMPWYVKQAAEYQTKMQEGYKDDAKYLLAISDAGGLTDEIQAKHTEARDKRNKYAELFNNFYDQEGIIDWRVHFLDKPLPVGCNEENNYVPDTGGAIDWGDNPQTPDVPVDTDRSG